MDEKKTAPTQGAAEQPESENERLRRLLNAHFSDEPAVEVSYDAVEDTPEYRTEPIVNE